MRHLEVKISRKLRYHPIGSCFLMEFKVIADGPGLYHTELGNLLSLEIHMALSETTLWQNGASYSCCLWAN